MTVINNPNLLWFIGGYGIIMIVMGIYYSKKVDTSEDFILAGKRLGTLVLMGTLLATWCGSGTVTGGGNSKAYSFGLWPALIGMPATVIGIGIMYAIAPKVRKFGKYTISEILEEKYGSKARLLAAIIVIMAYVGITSYQFKGLGFILNVTTGISVEVGTIIAAVLIIFLATAGGLMSVAPTDALSAILMLVGLAIGIPTVIRVAGGWSEVVKNVPPSHLTFTGGLTPIQLVGFTLPTVVLLLSDQNMYQRLASSREGEGSKISIIGWLIGLMFITPAVAIIAFTSRSMFADIDPGMALIATTTVMPVFIGGLLLAAAAAFIVTTGNSYLLSCATNITYDIYGVYINPNASDKKKLMLTRVFVVTLGIIAFVLMQFFPTILAIQMYAYTVYGASLTPAVLAIFFWKRVNKYGGLSSMVVGLVSTLIWEMPLARPGEINSIIISLPLAIIALYLGTVLTENKTKNITEEEN